MKAFLSIITKVIICLIGLFFSIAGTAALFSGEMMWFVPSDDFPPIPGTLLLIVSGPAFISICFGSKMKTAFEYLQLNKFLGWLRDKMDYH